MFTHVIGRSFVYCLIRRSLSIFTNNSILLSSLIRICILGSGPSGFLLTLHHTMPATIDMIKNLSIERGFKILGEKTLENLAKTGITDIIVLDTLRQSRIRHMILVDRCRLIQILSFTIKEFRELTKLTGLQSMLNKEDFN
ncbi:unnamed protein product [Rotaria sordida]|uniref:Uncharacterized protein n=1 Tax=Rotaria sordida TaxID=392033 RepID=A0A819XMS2_9BILA|nr:unnamed protein product [Rotaria sordida]CAF4144272.1 unnamed protein product [Rotaria sordida]